MDSEIRRIKESPIIQGEDERIAYTLTTTPWGSSPTSPAVVLKDSSDNDVSSTYLTGSPSVSGDIITLPVMHSLVDGTQYRLEVKFTISGNVLEAWTEVYGKE